MTQAKLKFANFGEYLSYSDDPNNYIKGNCELIDLVDCPSFPVLILTAVEILNAGNLPYDPNAFTATRTRSCKNHP